MSANPNTTNQHIINWVKETAEHCQPEAIVWCDGSDE